MKPYKINPLPEPTWDWSWLTFYLIGLSGLLGLLLTAMLFLHGQEIALLWQTPTPTATATATPRPTFTPPLPTPKPTATSAEPTPTSTRVVVADNRLPVATATPFEGKLKLPQLQNKLQTILNMQSRDNLPLPESALPPPDTMENSEGAPAKPKARPNHLISFSRSSPVVLAHYFAWFDGTGWNDCNISMGDKPLQPYASDDPATIARHVQMARQIGLDGFTLHWFTPGDRTDRNFSTLLTAAQGHDFFASVVFSRHIYGVPASRQIIADALRYIIKQHTPRPSFLRVDNKPVIFFTDVYRVPAAIGQTPVQFWAEVRDQVDPARQTVWIAEGLDMTYLSVFDGLYVFKITHATAPNDYLKDSAWAAKVRQWEKQTGQPKLWIATISPGWDDRRAGCRQDIRMPAPLHRRDREEGGYYRANFASAIASQPDWLIVGSFNEWVEGSYIEPSVLYGDKYMKLTKELVEQFKANHD